MSNEKKTVTLTLDADQAQELSLLLARAAREGRLEAELADVRADLTAARTEAGWVSPSRSGS